MGVILYFPIIEKNRLGYIDFSGRVVIPPRFYLAAIEEAPFFREGLAPVRLCRRWWKFERVSAWGYLEPSGQLAVDPAKTQYPIVKAGAFQDGCAKVLVQKPQGLFMGLINDAGRFLGGPRYLTIGEFKEGVAPATIRGAGPYEAWTGFIDRFGVQAIEFDFLEAGAFRHNLAPACRAEAGAETGYGLTPSYGFIDHEGDWIVTPQYEAVRWFENGFGPVCINGKWGVIDLDERWVVQPRYDDASGYIEGLATVWLERRTGMIDTHGEPLVPIEFDELSGFHEGFCSVQLGFKWGLLDRLGNRILAPERYDELGQFSEGLAPAQEGFHWGFINTRGEPAIPLKFELVTPFRQGLAAVSAGGIWGFINYNGEYAIAPRFSYAEPFQNGLARVFIGAKLAWINQLGDFIWGPAPISLPYRSTAAKVWR